MDELNLQTMLSALQSQRNAALDQVVQLVGQLALLEKKVADFEVKETSKKQAKTQKE